MSPQIKKSSKKQAREQVYSKLAVALSEFKFGIKDKKFENNLRRASRLFARDIIKASKKEHDMIRKQAKADSKKAKDTATTLVATA